MLQVRAEKAEEAVKLLLDAGYLKAEDFEPAYDLVDVDYQIVHASRGCFRRCNFCGTWKIEPDVTYKKSIKDEIKKKKIVFYDNNLIANPHIKDILAEIAEFRFPNKNGSSGFVVHKFSSISVL